MTYAKIKYFVQNMWWFWFWKWVWVAGRTQGRLWILVFCLGIMGVLVPAPLLEFRYFTIPFFLIALHTKIPEEIELGTSFCMTILYSVLNAFTMYLFLFRPFHWANDPGGIQRFMWWKFCHLLFSHITWILKLYLCLEIKFDWYRQTQHSWFVRYTWRCMVASQKLLLDVKSNWSDDWNRTCSNLKQYHVSSGHP